MRKITLLLIFASFFSFLTQAQAEVVIAVGDVGKDNLGQKAVAEAMTRLCESQSCDVGFLLGDNVYDRGITDPKDPLMDRMFRKYYSALKIPFQVILGNHDNGKWSNDWERGQAQVRYAQLNPQFLLPSEYYWFETAEMVVAALDTSRLMWDKDVGPQAQIIEEAYFRAQRTGKWFVVMGHHPYISNGKHGNAGKYDGIGFFGPVSGKDVKKFVERYLCGRAALYISGHDHNLQVLDAQQKGCKLIQIVSGAGASIEEWREKNELMFGALELGFFKLDITKERIRIQSFNEQNKELYSYDLRR